MPNQRSLLVDVGMDDFLFPIRAASRVHPDGIPTIATIAIRARVNREFEARWINKFMQIIHNHRGSIGPTSLGNNLRDYLDQLNADSVRIELAYPYFVEKQTPVSGEPCLVSHHCSYRAKLSSSNSEPNLRLAVEVPTMTTDPSSSADQQHGLFAQRTDVTVEIDCYREVYPEDIVDIVDKHCLVPVYSYLTPEDEEFLIRRAHERSMSSVALTDAIRRELTGASGMEWFSVKCRNRGLLHLYRTEVGVENIPSFPFVDAGAD